MTQLTDEQQPERERLPLSPDEAVQTLTKILRLLESIEGHDPPLPKARVLLRGIIGCGITSSPAADLLATARKEGREAAFTAIGVELRRYGANIR